ncbi:COQ9 family protein [Paracoccus shanxieyensis]|uniref:COQ9 family protein n=1 Tax=Paracoccus shanxieyensis TaxID=2675752 RepID=A0A6L6IQX5_9RHOB|nr:COQ9 family protein [Paracoccus shanxieyensis]MTH62886.1 COQ9 family protein [Paracoccus shanxieyensis]MTH86030.1 COQ9 family protein [Paracoccus shanxieyensis]
MTSERDRLIDAALNHVIFEGMGDKAITAAAQELGMSVELARVYLPRGGADLAAAYHRRGDAALREWLATSPLQGRFRDRITDAVMHRLSLSDREMARAGAVILSLPQNAALGARLIWESADAIWDGLGDTSDDVNWYSKRATLSTVYGATVLYWLGDVSPDAEDTRAFLERRIEGVMRFEKIKGRVNALPGISTLSSLATGWIRRPAPRHGPGRATAQPSHGADA